MIELLVVLAIVAIMTSLAIPIAARWGAFSNDELNSATRNLHSMLRAAQIHAATYRVNAGVAYYAQPLLDSVTNQEVLVATAYAMVYSKPGSDKYYFVRDSDGQFRTFPTDIVLFLSHPDPLPQNLGMTQINLWTGETGEEVDEGLFWAHVFKPTSDMVTTGGRERFVVQLGPTPTEDPEVRLVRPDLGVLFLPGTNDTNLMGSRIELFRSTGRVKVAS